MLPNIRDLLCMSATSSETVEGWKRRPSYMPDLGKPGALPFQHELSEKAVNSTVRN